MFSISFLQILHFDCRRILNFLHFELKLESQKPKNLIQRLVIFSHFENLAIGFQLSENLQKIRIFFGF